MATAIITGRLDGRGFELMLNVSPDGFISIGRSTNGEVRSSNKTEVEVLTANKGEYEAIILDGLGID
jgi:hypothetical protein